MNRSLSVSASIDRLLAVVYRTQTPTGGFDSYSFSNIPPRGAHISQTTFQTSLILCALGILKDYKKVNLISKRGINYLLSQQNSRTSWNYWDRSTAKSKTIPDDWDDTSLALAAIDNHNPGLIDEARLVSAVELLIAAEESEGGPYNTWLSPEWRNTVWHDIDIGVNANIGRFLARKNVNLPGLTTWIDEKISHNNYHSKYYSEIPLLYFLSTWYRGEYIQKLQQRITHHLLRKNNPLDTALLISAWIRLGGSIAKVRTSIKKIFDYSQGEIGMYPFFIEEIKNGIPHYSGSPALTAACMGEALALFEKGSEQEVEQAAARSAAADANKIGVLATERFSRLPEMKKFVQILVSQLAVKDPTHEIALLPQWFVNSLNNKSKDTSKKFLNELGTINTLGWIGYTIVDKILDGEKHEELLPIANICIREVTTYYENLFAADTKAVALIREILDGIDRTNFWEHSNCKLKIEISAPPALPRASTPPPHPGRSTRTTGRDSSEAASRPRTQRWCYLPREFPHYGNYLPLAEKSLGHAIGPIAIILKSKNFSASSRFTTTLLVKQFFIHYIIARQLNDDAHDWLEDLEQGFLNSASVELLKDWEKSHAVIPSTRGDTHAKRDGGVSVLDLEKDKEFLQKIFWNKTIDTIADRIRAHSKRAHTILRKLKKSGILAETEKLESLLVPLEQSANMAIRERDSTEKFLREYK